MSSVQTFSGHSLISELLINQLEGKLKQPLSVVIDAPCGYAFKGMELVKEHLNSLISIYQVIASLSLSFLLLLFTSCGGKKSTNQVAEGDHDSFE